MVLLNSNGCATGTTGNNTKMKTKKFFGLILCALRIHESRCTRIKSGIVIGIGCPRCKRTWNIIDWDFNIPPPPRVGETEEQYRESVEDWNDFRSFLTESMLNGAIDKYLELKK
jgi:hypothetical protein